MSNNLFFNYMESLNPFTPIEFNCDMCHHSHNKYLPPGTKYTTCARCGNLIDISKLDQRAMRLSSRSRMTNLNTNNRATARRSNNPFTRQVRFSSNQMMTPYANFDDDDDYNQYGNTNEFDFEFDNFGFDEPFSNRNNNNNNRNQQQGMFQINIPNENYNRRSNNARRMRMNNMNNIFDDEDLFDDFDFELERDLDSMMRNLEDFSANVDLPTLGRVGRTIISSTKPKPKLKKEEMTKKMYIKNDKGKLEAPTCCICLLTLKLKDGVCRLPCKHIFHFKCIEKWAETKQECPYCRSDMNKKPETAKKKVMKK